MFICDEKFLASLNFSSEDERCQIIKRLLREPEITTGHVKVLVLADLHLQGGENQCFDDRLAAVRRWFGWQPGDTRWDALVVAGDLVAGNHIGWQETDDAVALADCHSKLVKIHAEAGEQINRSVYAARALVIPGNHDVVRMGGNNVRRAQMSQMLTKKGPHQGSSFVNHVQCPLSGDRLLDAGGLRNAPRLLLMGGSLGVLAIIGLDSNQLAYTAPGLEYPGYIGNDQRENVRGVTDCLKKVFNDRPLFLWAVWHHHLLPVYNTEQTSKLIPLTKNEDPSHKQLLGIFDAITIDGRAIVEEFSDMGISLAIHGHMHAPCIQRVSYSPDTDQILNILACPSCLERPDAEHPYVGATLVEIDLERGLAEISINGEKRELSGGIDCKRVEMHKTFPIPLISTSRVPLGEIRLYRRLNAWLGKCLPEHGLLGGFPRELPRPFPSRDLREQSAWERSVQDCLSNTGYVPVCMGTPQEVLRNGMLTREQIAALPRKKYRLLLTLKECGAENYDILLNNFSPLRTPEFGSWDAPLLPAFKHLHGLISSWLLDVRRRLDEHREQERQGQPVRDKVRRLEDILRRLMEMPGTDEELVTIATRQFLKFSPTDGVPVLYEYSLTHWPLLSSNKNPDLNRFLMEHVNHLDSSEVLKTSFRDYSRGLVWVPINLWQQSDAIRSRNADVMQWVDETLAELRKVTSVIPRWLVSGSGEELRVGITHLEQRPFGNGDIGRDVAESQQGSFPDSLVRGLDNVMTGKDNVHVYRGQGICMGRLRIESDQTHGRIRIAVYVCDNERREKLAGYLRPVQRYVLAQGLRRAERLRREINNYLRQNRSVEDGFSDFADLGVTSKAGYLRVTLSEIGEISVLPLIVEQISVGDQEGDVPEFILCDGNHRLVQYLLVDKCESVGCAIVAGSPKQPYYAWPYSRWDWNVMLQNQLEDTPDLYSKYTPRYHNDATREDIKHAPESYRQFFRDLSTGFGDIGTQAGRLV